MNLIENYKQSLNKDFLNIDLKNIKFKTKEQIDNTINIDMQETINGMNYKIIKKLEGGKTNDVFLAIDVNGKKVVIKKSKSKDSSLKREIAFFGFISKNNINGFPKLLKKSDSNESIILDFKEGENGQDINVNNDNWIELGKDFGKILKDLHLNIDLNNNEKNIAIDNIISYFDIGENDLSFFKKDFNKEKEILKSIMKNNKNSFVMNHGDYSPHNCLFKKDDKGNFFISTILDPSGRAGYGFKEFDIVYLFNTRHNKNKDELKKGFLENYSIDTNSELYLQFDKVMKMYLIELYNLMGLKEDSIKILKDYKNQYIKKEN